MKLADWLKQHDVTQAQFADDIGVSKGAVSGYCNGAGWPEKKTAEKIFARTDGAVTPNDFLEAAE